MVIDNTEIEKQQNVIAETKYKRLYLSKVAHEFKQPINVLGIIINQIFNWLKNSNPEQIKLLYNLKNLGSYIQLLISDIIDFSNEKNSKFLVSLKKFNFYEAIYFAKEMMDFLIQIDGTKKGNIKINVECNKSILNNTICKVIPPPKPLLILSAGPG